MNFINEIWEFLRNNVEILVNGAYLIIAVILLVTKKKLPKSEKITAIYPIIDQLPEYINKAEEDLGPKTGFSKLLFVLSKIQTECEARRIKYDEKFWTKKIENILETPEKKETK